MWSRNPICAGLIISLAGVLGAPTERVEGGLGLWSFDGTGFVVDTLPVAPVNARGNAKGWLGRWLSVGGEGEVTVHLSAANLTLPHRPAAFPARLDAPFDLPLSGELVNFVSLPPPPSPIEAGAHDSQACIPPSTIRWIPPSMPYKIALVERGGCDFATKVRAAQERGAAGVVVGDMIGRPGETDEEGRERESLITMFSPEDTDNIFIPSVFVSRASYLLLRDVLARGHEHGDGRGPWVDLGEGEQEGGALSSLLSFALLMPSLFLLATIAIHRVRVARQREADRAPPIVVLSLPERIWSPDIVWEKDDSSSDSDDTPRARSTTPTPQSSSQQQRPAFNSKKSSLLSIPTAATTSTSLPPPPPISPSDVAPAHHHPVIDMPLPSSSRDTRTRKERRKSKRYYSKDECAICMDMFKRGEVVRILPCGHVFHKDECDEWLMKWRKLCPTCRADVTLPPGAAAEGTTMTPIAPVPEGAIEEDEHERSGIQATVGHAAQRVRAFFSRSLRFGRRAAAGEDDERAPLLTPQTGR